MDIPVALVGLDQQADRLVAEAIASLDCHPERPRDVTDWLRAGGVRAVLVGDSGDQHREIREASQVGGAVIVAACRGLTPELWRALLRSGASTVLALDGSAASLRQDLKQALLGIVTLPTSTLCRIVVPAGLANISRDELVWLTSLAEGASVERLAEEAGFSVRTMKRKLADVYAKIGVSSRPQAVVWLANRGLLDHLL